MIYCRAANARNYKIQDKHKEQIIAIGRALLLGDHSVLVAPREHARNAGLPCGFARAFLSETEDLATPHAGRSVNGLKAQVARVLASLVERFPEVGTIPRRHALQSGSIVGMCRYHQTYIIISR